MEMYEVLEKALALIEDERDWCPDGPGWGTVPRQRCAVAALGEIVNPVVSILDVPAFQALDSRADGVASFNDSHTHAEVVALFQDAIRAEKAKAGIPVDLPATPVVVEETVSV